MPATHPIGKPAFGPKNPFMAEVIEKRLLNRPGAGKETVFLRFGLRESGMVYETGDLLGVYVKNSRDAVDAYLSTATLSGDEEVRPPRTETTMLLRNALREKLHFQSKPTPSFLRAAAAAASPAEGEALLQIVGDEERLRSYAETRWFTDVIRDFPSIRLSAQALVENLPPLAPRLYSMASSQFVHPTEAHLAVAVVRYEREGQLRSGVASAFLAEEVKVGDKLPIFTARGKLRLPDNERDIIMIGPGTGVAPFRAFLEERIARGSQGRNWLFYGHRHKADDFYFQDELESWQSSGRLTKLSLAWSRDGDGKRYVQHLLWEERRELVDWLKRGAYLYLCGEKSHMAVDVQDVLKRIGEDAGMSMLLEELRREKRLQTDTY